MNQEELGISENPAWMPILKWASRHRCLHDLLLLIYMAGLRERPDLLGTLIKEIAAPETYEVLEHWLAGQDGGIASLLRVARAATQNPEVLTLTPPIERQAVPNADDLGASVRDLYVAALLIQHLPFSDTARQHGYRILRTWFLVHAATRATRGNFSDSNLCEVASGLRLAGQIKPLWRDLAQKLSDTGAQTLAALDHHIINKSETLIAGKEFPSQTSFLRAIAAVARYEDAADSRSAETWKPSGRLLDVLSHVASSPPEQTSHWLDEAIQAELPGLTYTPETEFSEAFIDVAADARRSYTHTRLATNSVLLAAAEARHYLPWTWQHPNPVEITELERWTVELLRSTERADAALGALIWVASHTGRSLRRALDIVVDKRPGEEWTLSPALDRLHRTPPLRQSGWEPKDREELQWVTPVADQIRIDLPLPVTTALQAISKRPGRGGTLGTLWLQISEESAESRMRRLRPAALDRVTPGMLQGLLGLRAYEYRGDSAFARLIASHPQSGLPGACAYAHWPAEAAESLLASQDSIAPRTTVIPSAMHKIGLGSRCAPLESRLQIAIRDATERLRKIGSEGDLLSYHNNLVGYLTLAVLAATGMRPVSDPIESPDLLDSEARLLYVADKNSGGPRQGRLVPLPGTLVQALSVDYRAHLARLADHLRKNCPALASEISLLASRRLSVRLPFLFMLKQDGALTWRSVSPSAISDLALFDCPLPLRLFRHRHANALRDRQLNPEIIDGLLGHAEGGAESYGDYSPRCWADDMTAAKEAIEDAYGVLGFEPIPECLPGNVLTDLCEGALPNDSLFGSRAREHRRRQQIKQARESARAIIADHTRKTPLAELDEAALEKLSHALLFSPTGMPRTNGMLQYRYLLRDLDRLWRNEGKRVRLPRRYAQIEQDRSPFHPSAIGVLPWSHDLAETRIPALHALVNENLPVIQCRLLGALLLLCESRLTNRRLLDDVMASRNYRIMMLGDRAYLEYAENLHTAVDPPVRRFPISTATAMALDDALANDRAVNWAKRKIPPWVEPLIEQLEQYFLKDRPATVDVLLDRLISRVDQLNMMTLPGVLAGYLSGRVRSAALDWSDTFRLATGRQLDLVAAGLEPADDEEPDNNETDLAPAPRTRDADGDVDSRLAPAREVIKAVKAILNETELHRGKKNLRRDQARRLKAKREAYANSISSAINLLIQWTEHLLQRPRQGSKAKEPRLLQASSVTRYFDALAQRFQEVAYDADLLALDAESVTELYEDLLTCQPTSKPGYLGRRLIEFHRLARKIGVAEPHWDELPLEAVGWAVAPGFITEADYQATLRLLLDAAHDEEQRYQAAFLLLACYRFGLRAGEAFGLRRSDWAVTGETTVIRVVRNRYRDLKTLASRRQVPSLFSLSELEQTIVTQMLSNSEALHGDDDLAPLFGRIGNARMLANREALARSVISALKSVTGNPSIVLHHARHTTAARIYLALLGLALPNWLDGQIEQESAKFAGHVQKQLLGRTGVTRRAPWALAVYLGHRSPATAVRSYLHFLSDWLSQHLSLAHTPNTALARATNLDTLPVLESTASTPLPRPALTAPATPVKLLQLLRLISRSSPIDVAALRLGLAAGAIEPLKHLLAAIGNTRFTPRKQEPAIAMSFLTRITDEGWQRLITLAAQAGRERRPADGGISVPTLMAMIGESRQLVVTEPEQFQLLRDFLEYFGISDDYITVVYSHHAYPPDLEAAEQAGFNLQSLENMGRGQGRFQIDFAQPSSRVSNPHAAVSPQTRYAVVTSRNRDGEVRNRLELVLLAAVYSACFGEAPA